MYQFYLFDLDGTLSQSEPGIFHCIRYALNAADLPELPEEVLKTFIGPSLYDSFTANCHVNHEQALWLVAKYRERYNEIGLYETSIYEGIPETLQALQSRGAKLGVATSKPTEPTKKILKRFGLAPYFDVVVGSNPDGTGSDKQELIAECLHRLRESDGNRKALPGRTDALMIGDRKYDILGGHACGIDTAGVLYGYGSLEEFVAAGAEHIIEHPAELLEL